MHTLLSPCDRFRYSHPECRFRGWYSRKYIQDFYERKRYLNAIKEKVSFGCPVVRSPFPSNLRRSCPVRALSLDVHLSKGRLRAGATEEEQGGGSEKTPGG